MTANSDRPSFVAQLIAMSTLFVGSDKRLSRFVPEDAITLSSKFLQEVPGIKSLITRVICLPVARPFVAALERWIKPGISLHYMLRKRQVEKLVRDALSLNEIETVIVLGAGFDTLAHRLSNEFKNKAFIEIDTEATVSIKMRVYESPGLSRPNLKLASLRLGEFRWQEKIREILSANARNPVLFVAEGLLMYLTQSDVEELFDFIASIESRPVSFVFTFVEPDSSGRLRPSGPTPIANFLLKFKGECYNWGICRKDIASFLQGQGYKLIKLFEPADELETAATIPASARLNLPRDELVALARISK